MVTRRIPTVAESDTNVIEMEGRPDDRLPDNRVYVDPHSGRTVDGRRGGKLRDLRGDEIEILRTTWFRGA